MKTKLLAFAQRGLRRVLQLFSLGTVMFIMEACYGAYTDNHYTNLVTLRVVNLEGEPISGIEVYVYAPDAADNRGARVGQTAEDGTLAVDLYQVGVDSSCSLWLVDADGNQNGGSYTSKSVHVNGFNSVVTTAMSEK